MDGDKETPPITETEHLSVRLDASDSDAAYWCGYSRGQQTATRDLMWTLFAISWFAFVAWRLTRMEY